MSIIKNVQAILEADTALTAILGDNIYMTVAPQGAEPPFIVWNVVSNAPYTSLGCPADSDQERIQLDSYSRDPSQSRQLAALVSQRIQKHGNIISGAVPSYEQDTKLYRYSLDCSIFHKRAA